MPEASGAITQVMEATERTMATGTARLTLQEPVRDTPAYFMGHAKAGCNPASPVFWLMKVATRHSPDVLASSGWADFVSRRYELDAGHWMVRVHGTNRFTGPNESRLRRDRRVQSSSTLLEPLWLMEVLRGAVDATEAGGEEVNGVTCRRYDVAIDFKRAAAASQYGLAQPLVPPAAAAKRQGMDTLGSPRLSADVFIDSSGMVRRIHVRGFLMNVTMDLTDFGTAVDTTAAPSEGGLKGGALPAESDDPTMRRPL